MTLTALHLRDLAPEPSLRERAHWGWEGHWHPLPWCPECEECGDSLMACVPVFDGDYAVCATCGLVATVSADDGGVCVSAAHSQLTPAALAGLWRLLGIP